MKGKMMDFDLFFGKGEITTHAKNDDRSVYKNVENVSYSHTPSSLVNFLIMLVQCCFVHLTSKALKKNVII